MKLLYRILSAIIYFILWPYGRIRAGVGSELWRGRLGLIADQGKIDIWIHAASVGETKIAGYLIDYLLHKRPGMSIYLTTMTAAGHNIAVSLKNANVSVGYFPIDTAGAVGRTLKRINPRLLVIAETEIWPNLIEAVNGQKTPIVLVNGRMSDKAFDKYKLAEKMFTELLSYYARIYVKSEADKKKFMFFKLPETKVTVAGDMKFDAPILPRSIERIRKTRQLIGASENDFVLVAGSTRPGEEELIIKLFGKMAALKPALRLVLAPRHLDRIEEIKSIISMQNCQFGIYGSGNGVAPITLVDRMGELNELYQAADLAFVGGTLVNLGGHNILEPVWAGTPVVFGPYIGNIKESTDYVISNNYGAMVKSVEELRKVISELAANKFMFSIKSEEDLMHSPTAVVGDYIVERLSRV